MGMGGRGEGGITWASRASVRAWRRSFSRRTNIFSFIATSYLCLSSSIVGSYYTLTTQHQYTIVMHVIVGDHAIIGDHIIIRDNVIIENHIALVLRHVSYSVTQSKNTQRRDFDL